MLHIRKNSTDKVSLKYCLKTELCLKQYVLKQIEKNQTR